MNFRNAFLLVILFSAFGLRAQNADTLIFKQDFIPGIDTVLVFHPNTKSSELNQPAAIVVLLHGWGGYYGTWNDMVDLKELADRYDMMIVCPDGFHDSWYINSPLIENHQMERFIAETLVDTLRSEYSTDSGAVFITGQSMGGYAAIRLTMFYPEIFTACGGMSVVPDLTLSKLSKTKIDSLIPQTDQKNFSLFSSTKLLEGKKIIIDCGREDTFYDMNIMLYESCLANKVDIMLALREGKHNRDYWAGSIEHHLVFFKSILEDRVED